MSRRCAASVRWIFRAGRQRRHIKKGSNRLVRGSTWSAAGRGLALDHLRRVHSGSMNVAAARAARVAEELPPKSATTGSAAPGPRSPGVASLASGPALARPRARRVLEEVDIVVCESLAFRGPSIARRPPLFAPSTSPEKTPESPTCTPLYKYRAGERPVYVVTVPGVPRPFRPPR